MLSRNTTRALVVFSALAIAGATKIANADSVSPADSNGIQGTDGWSFGKFNYGITPSTTSIDPTTFAAFTNWTGPVNVATPSGPAVLSAWNDPGNSDPNVSFNAGPSDYETGPGLDGDEIFRAGSVELGPYKGPTVVQYQVPFSADYKINATFQTVQVGNSVPNAYVYVNGVLKYSQLLSDPSNALLGDVATFSPPTAFNLSAGQTVDFVVWGSDSDNKTTELTASVSPRVGAAVPLPKAAGVGFGLLAGIGALISIQKRFSRKLEIG